MKKFLLLSSFVFALTAFASDVVELTTVKGEKVSVANAELLRAYGEAVKNSSAKYDELLANGNGSFTLRTPKILYDGEYRYLAAHSGKEHGEGLITQDEVKAMWDGLANAVCRYAGFRVATAFTTQKIEKGSNVVVMNSEGNIVQQLNYHYKTPALKTLTCLP